MNEKTVIQGRIKSAQIFKTIMAIGIAIIILGLIVCAVKLTTGTIYKSFYKMRMPYTQAGFNYFDLLFCGLCFDLEIGVGLLIYFGVLIILIGVFLNFMMSKCEITVTDKRVIGKVNFGKRVDLPLNHISAVAQGPFSGIAVATSSGRITFWFIDNRDEVFSALSNLIRNFQIQKEDVSYYRSNEPSCTSNADELRKYKELLDMGALTQEEFDAKKKQLLGL